MSDVSKGQRLTGERTLPHIWHENYWFRRHEAAYLHVAAMLAQSRVASVLDAGCGEGYGCDILARASGGRTVGLDYDEPTLTRLRRTYAKVRPVKGNLVTLPFPDDVFDVVVSMQVIEHIWERQRFVAECARVVRTGGWMAISTPNRLTFSPGLGRGEKPRNPFHVSEFDADELETVVGQAAVVATVTGLRHGPRIQRWESQHGSLVEAQLGQPHSCWAEDVADFVVSLSAADFECSEEHLDTSLDLLITAIGK